MADLTPRCGDRMLEYGVMGCKEHVTGWEKWPGFPNLVPKPVKPDAAGLETASDSQPVPEAKPNPSGT